MAPPARQRIHSVAVELTDRCNLRCSHCYNAGRPPPGSSSPHRTAQVLERLQRILALVELDNVTLTGGEPFSFDGIAKAIDLLTSRDVPFQIISNGALLDAALADRLAHTTIRSVQLSLHAPDPQRHDAITGARSFEATVRAARLLRERRIAVVGCIVVTRDNARHVGDTLRTWESLGVERVALSRFSPAGMAVEHAPLLLPTVPDMMAAFEQAAALSGRTGMQISCTMPIPPCSMETRDYAPVRFGACAIGTSKQEFALGTDGRLRHCTLHREPISADVLDLHGDSPLGDVLPRARQYRDTVPAFCGGCRHAATCLGGCGAAAAWMLDSARAFPDPFLWQHVDDAFAERLEALRGAPRPSAGPGRSQESP